MSQDLVAALDRIVERCNRSFCWAKTTDGPRRVDEAFTPHHLMRHVTGKAAFGLCPMTPGESTTRLALLDLDSHKGEIAWAEMLEVAAGLIIDAHKLGLEAIPFRSSGGQGIHLFFLWDQPQDAYSVRQLLIKLLANGQLSNGTGGIAKREVEVFPKQDRIPANGYGNMFILPLAGKSQRLSADTLGDLPRRLAARWDWPLSKPVPVIEKPAPTPREHDEAGASEVAQLLAKIPNTGEHELDYDRWRNVIFAIHHATDGADEGLALAHEFSARSSKYDPDFLDNRVWPYITSERDSAVTIDTLRFMAREHEDPADDFEALGDLPAESAGAGKVDRFKVLSEDEILARPRPKWIVKGVVPQAELGVLYGASGSGKSFLALDLFAAVVAGRPWRSLRTVPTTVVYVAAEGQGGFRNRLEAYRQHHGAPSGLKVVLDGPNLLKKDALLLAEQINKAGGAGLIVIDTLAQVSPGGDENSAEDMGRLLLSCRYLHKVTGAMVVLIHHAGKDLTKGARGWSGLKAAADVELEVNRLDDDRWLKVTKSKDGEDGTEYPFKLQSVTLGMDEDGDAITSCVVTHQERRTASQRREPKGKVERLVWRLAHETSDLGGGSIPVESLIGLAAGKLPHDPQAGRDRRREYIKQALMALVDRGFLTLEENEVRVPEEVGDAGA